MNLYAFANKLTIFQCLPMIVVAPLPLVLPSDNRTQFQNFNSDKFYHWLTNSALSDFPRMIIFEITG
jgi:hypothetical protein